VEIHPVMKIEFSDQALAARIFSCANEATNIAPINNAHPCRLLPFIE
jgi:hypothetical protein